MRNARLDNLIDEEIRRRLGMLDELDKTKGMLIKAAAKDMVSLERGLEEGKRPRDIPDYHSIDTYLGVCASKELDFFADAHVLATLFDLLLEAKPDSFDRTKFKNFRGWLNRNSSPGLAYYLIFEWFIKGRIRDIERRLPGYEATINEIAEDPTLIDSPLFLSSMRNAYERIRFELSDISPPVVADDHSQVAKKMDKQSMEKYFLRILNIRTQEMLVEALSRVYGRYKEGFDQ